MPQGYKMVCKQCVGRKKLDNTDIDQLPSRARRSVRDLTED